MLKRIAAVFLSVLLVAGLVPAGASAAVPVPVTLSLNNATIAVGGTATLTFTVADAADVYGSAVDVYYDPAVVQPANVSAGGFVAGTLSTDQYFTTNESGTGANNTRRISTIALRLGHQTGANGNGTVGSFQFTGLAAGTVTFQLDNVKAGIQLVDSTGALIPTTGANAVTLTVGAAATPVISTPASGAVVGANAAVTGTAAANAVLLPLVDGVAAQATVNATATGAFSFIPTLTDGSHTVKVRDVATGLDSADRTFTVDTLAPSLTVADIAPNASTTVSGTAADSHLNHVYVQVNPTGDPVTADAVTVDPSTGSFSKNLTFTANGIYTVRVTATDLAGNSKVIDKTVLIQLVTTGPAVELQANQPIAPVGSTFTVDIVVKDVTDFAGTDVKISFPKDLLQVDAVNNSGLLELCTKKVADNAAGTIWYAAATSYPQTGSSFTVATITFRVMATGNAAIHVTSSELQNSQSVTIEHQNVDTSVQLITGGTVTGQVKLQGRPSAANGGVRVKVVGQNIATTTAADGTFTLNNVPAGTQQLYITFPNPQGTSPASIYYLASVTDPLTVVTGGTTTLPLLTLKGGDANSDNKVTLTDLTTLARAYGTSAGQTGYDYRADFSGDQKIGLSDLTILANGYGLYGAPAPAGE